MFTKLFKKDNDDYINKFTSKVPKNYEGKIDEGTLRDLFVRYILLWNDKGLRIIQSFKMISITTILLASIPTLQNKIIPAAKDFFTFPSSIKILYFINIFVIFLVGMHPFVARFYWNKHDIERLNSSKLFMFWFLMLFYSALLVAFTAKSLGKDTVPVSLAIVVFSIIIYLIEILVYQFVSIAKSFSNRTAGDLEAVLYKLQIFTYDMRPSQKISVINYLISYYKADLKLQKRPLFLSQTQNSIAFESLKLIITIIGAIYSTMLLFSKVFGFNIKDLLEYALMYGAVGLALGFTIWLTFKTEFLETKRLINESNNGLMLRTLYELKQRVK